MQIPDKKTRVRRSWVWILDPAKYFSSEISVRIKTWSRIWSAEKLRDPSERVLEWKNFQGPFLRPPRSRPARWRARLRVARARSGASSAFIRGSDGPERWDQAFADFRKSLSRLGKWICGVSEKIQFLLKCGPLERIKTNKSKKGRRFKI